jgi:hypothetical protein
MRNISVLIVCGAALCGAVPLGAQSLESRVANAPANAVVRFTFDTKPGVCGDGEHIVTRHGDGDDDYSITQVESDGTSFTSRGRTRTEDVLRNCQEGPGRVELTRSGSTYSALKVSVGGSASVPATDLGTVSAAEAVGFLLKLAETTTPKVGRKALFAATLANANTEAATGLIAITRRSSVQREVRKEAVFWLSQTRDPRAIGRLKELLADNDEDTDVRKSAIFGLTQLKDPSVIPILLSTARGANSRELQKDAVFWLGQMAGEKSTEGLKSILDDSSEEMEVRETAVFALSQQKGSKTVDMLMDIARSSKEPKLRRSALFWLGQKAGDDPRVLRLFQDILLKNE